MTTIPTGTVTFLFTDIEGSTSLWEHFPNQMQLALARHDDILRQVIEQQGGYVFKTVGDAFCATFSAPYQAIAAAIQIQQQLALEPWPPEIGHLKVRMGLHTGSSQERDGDYFGSTVNRVARIEALAYGHQILLSQTTKQLLIEENQLPSEVSLLDLGEHQLKGLAKPEQIYQLVVPGFSSDFPPLKSSVISTNLIAHNNLPTPANRLIGREGEIAEITALLAKSHLVTLTGVGGTGKTRLALQIAHNLFAEFKDGAFFVALDNATEQTTFLTELTVTLNLKDQPGQTLLEVMKTYLADKEMLLVLDNFEQLVDNGASLVAALLKAAPKLKVLVTSRFLLQISSEREFPVAPLATPPKRVESAVATANLITDYPAVALFVERAKTVKRDFYLTAENRAAVVEICRKLDGLPLALELAAARLKVISPPKILERLNLKLLSTNSQDLPNRQQTLRGAIDWSYDLLQSDEQTLLNRLSIFVGGCTLEAAEAVCTIENDLKLEILDGIESLLQKSLLRQWDDDEGERRYGMLQTIREYALEKLTEQGQYSNQLSHYANYYSALVKEFENEQNVAEHQAERFFRLVESKYDNIQEVLYQSLETQKCNPVFGVNLIINLDYYWLSKKGYYSEAWRFIEPALKIAPTIGKNEYARLLYMAGLLIFRLGNYTTPPDYLETALSLAQEIEDKQIISHCLRILGNIAFMQGEPTKAKDYWEQALPIYREIGDKITTAYCLSNLGLLASIPFK